MNQQAPLSAASLAQAYDVALFDLDGVVYVGPHAVPHAVASIATAAELGMRAAYVTNNAARPPRVVGDHLRELGIACDDDDVVTSAQAAARLVAELVEPGAAVLVVGGAGLEEALRREGLLPVSSLDDSPVAVVQGFSPDLTWAALAEGAYALATGLPWVASNLDLTVPTVRGIAPGNGTLVAALQAATGRTPEVAGKPLRPLFDTAVARTAATHALVVGDRLDTDIEGAVAAGLDSLLVLTGVTSAEAAVLAPPHQRATYLGRDLRALLAPPLVAERDGEYWRCGGWVSLVEQARVLVVPATDASASSGDEMAALTAAAAAAAAYEGTLEGVDGLPLR